MNVNPFGLNSVYTTNNPSTMNANQSCGLHFGAGSGDYDCYQSSVPKKKENFWQKWKKWIIGGTVAVGVGILGIVGYNKGWFGKAKETVKALPKTEPSKPGNDFETALKTLGLSDGTIEGGTQIADLLKKTNEVTTNQFTEVARKIQEKVSQDTLSNDVNTAAVKILEQLRKNLANKNETIGNFNPNSKITDSNVLNDIITTSESEQSVVDKPVEELAEEPKAEPAGETSLQSESGVSGSINQADELPNESSQIDISGSAVQNLQEFIVPKEQSEASEKPTENEIKQLAAQLQWKSENIRVLLGSSDEARLNIIKNDAAWDLCDVIKKNKIKDNATFKFLIQDLLTKVNEKKDEFINDETRNGIGYLLEQVIINKDSFGIDNNILSSLVDQVCPRENGTIKKATGGTIACLAVAIKQGLINDKNLAFEADVITKDNVVGIAMTLSEANEDDSLKNNDAFISLVTSFYETCLTQKGVITQYNANNIALALSQANKDGSLKNNDAFKSLVTSFYEICLTQKDVITKDNAGDIFANLATAIKQGIIDSKNLKFGENVITKNNVDNIARALSKVSEDDSLKNNDAFKSLVTSFYKTCLTQKDVITKDNAGDIFANLATAIKQGVIDSKDLKFGENVITKYNAVGIAKTLSQANKDGSLKDNDAFKSLVKSVLTKVNEKKDELINNDTTRDNIGYLLEQVIINKASFDIADNILSSLVDQVCSRENGTIEKTTYGAIACLTAAIKQGLINDKNLAFEAGVITKDNVVGIAMTLSEASKDDSLKNNDAFISLVKSFYEICLTQKDVITQYNAGDIFVNLATAIKQGIIDSKNLKFGENVITKYNAVGIAKTLSQANEDGSLKDNDAFKSLVTSFYEICLTQKDVITQYNAGDIFANLATAIKQGIIDSKNLKFGENVITQYNVNNIALALSKVSKDGSLKNNDAFKSLVKSVLTKVNEKKDELINYDKTRDNIGYLLEQVIINKASFDIDDNILSSLVDQVCSRKNGTIEKATGGAIACLTAAIKQGLINDKNLAFGADVITKNNVFVITEALLKASEDDSLKNNDAFISLVTSFYKTCLTKKDVITKDNAGDIFLNLTVAIKQGFIKNDDSLAFGDDVITKDNVNNIARALSKVSEDDSLKNNDAFKSLLTSFYQE